jgi:hypothetical protein
MIMVDGKPVRARASGVLSDVDLEAVREFRALLARKVETVDLTFDNTEGRFNPTKPDPDPEV